MRLVYDRIENVLREVHRPMAAHEFGEINLTMQGEHVNCRRYVGCTEATLARRMREMVVLGRLVSSKSLGGVMFKKFALAPTPVCQEPPCPA